jgi:hypothetical protein
VEVGLDDEFDGEAELLGVSEGRGHVALRVDDDGPSGRLVTDQVGRVRQALQLVLLEDHGFSPSVRRGDDASVEIPRGVYAPDTPGGM